MQPQGTPEAAIPLLNNLLAWAAVIALIVVLYVAVRYGLKEGVFAFVAAVVVVGVFSTFAVDPAAGFAGAWEFMRVEVLGLEGSGAPAVSGQGPGS